MKTRKKAFGTDVIAGLITLAALFLFFLLQGMQEYLFFYREQQQLFLRSFPDVLSRLGGVGGVSLTLSQFLVQFFAGSHAGAVITAVLAAAALFILVRAAGISSGKVPGTAERVLYTAFFTWPVIAEAIALGDVMYSFQGFVAFVLAALALWAYAALCNAGGGASAAGRAAAGAVLGLALLYAAGPVAALFAVTVIVLDLCTGHISLSSFAASVAVALAGLVFVRLGLTEDCVHTFLPAGYYETLLSAPLRVYMSWILLPVALLLARGLLLLLRGRAQVPARVSVISVGALVMVMAAGWSFSSNDLKSPSNDMMRLSHFLSEGDWEAILKDERTRHSSNYLMMNFRNLALSWEGRLLDDLFKYPQKGSQGILASDAESGQDVNITYLDSEIYRRMGNVAAAMNSAFDTFTGIPCGSPAAAKILVTTNLARGYDAVAGKYIRMLEKTGRYRGWALRQRDVLEGKEKDAEIERLASDVPGKDLFVLSDSPFHDLEMILEENPADTVARDWLIAYMLLEKDFDRLRAFIEDNYGTPVLETLPRVLQEAVLVYAEEDREYCSRYGVSDEVYDSYLRFRRRFLELRNSRQDPTGPLRRDFGDTFWYYVMFQGLD